MGQQSRILAQLLGFDGYRVEGYRFVLADGRDWISIGRNLPPPDAKLVLRVTSRWLPRCSTCGSRCDKIHERLAVRYWRDLPMGTHPVVIE